VIELFCTGLLEAEYLAAFWIDPRHHVPDGTVLAGAVHALEDQQQRIAVGCVVKLLQRAQLFHVFLQEFLIPLLRFRIGIDNRRPFAEVDLFVCRHTVIFRIDGHSVPSVLRDPLLNCTIAPCFSLRFRFV
jgi:hypothetical protein